MQNIIEQLNENLKQLYRQAIDADEFIAHMQKSGKGKFASVFSKDTIFETDSKFFKPYVTEAAGDVAMMQKALETAPEPDKEALGTIVKKLEMLHITLTKFKQVMKDKT